MAVRLNVVMVHTPPAVAGAQHLAESAVGELIGRPGIDVTLVGSLDSIVDQSTDALTLESIASDVAVLDWRTPVQLVSKLASLGFHGVRTPHAEDQQADLPPLGSRKIYAFDMNLVTDARQLCKSLQDLLASRQVKTVTIGGAHPGISPTNSATNNPATGKTKPESSASPQPQKAIPATSIPVPSPPTTMPVSDRLQEPSSIDLDDLVDQLDELDP